MMNFTKSLKAVFMLCLLCVATTMTAATNISLSSLSIAAGETKSVDVILKNDAVVGSLQFDITLPAGLTIVDESFKANEQRIDEGAYTIFADVKANGTVRITALDNTGEGIAAGEGAIFSFDVTAGEGLVNGKITIANAEVTDTEGTPEETTVQPAVVEVAEAAFELQAVSEVSIPVGNTEDIDVVLVNSGDLLSFQCLIRLPEGIAFGADTEKNSITASDRLKGFTKNVQKQDDGSYKLTFTTLTNKLIGGNSGDVLFTIKVKAEKEVADAAIVLADGRATNVERKTVNFADVTIVVTTKQEAEPVDKTALNEEIANATKLLGEDATDAGKTLQEAIAAAQAVADKADATKEEVEAAVEALKKAEDTFKAAQQGEQPEVKETVVYSWSTAQGEETVTINEAGGKAVASDEQSVGYANATYTTIRLNGAKDFSTNTVTITLDNELKAGDKIAITAYRNKDAEG